MRKDSWCCLPLGNPGLEETEGNWGNSSPEKTKNKYKMCEKKSKKREFGKCEVSPLYNFNKNFT